MTFVFWSFIFNLLQSRFIQEVVRTILDRFNKYFNFIHLSPNLSEIHRNTRICF